MYEVTEINFEELSIEIAGVHIGMFTGTAGVDTDGSVTVITLEGWKNSERGFTHLEVKRHQSTRRFEDALAIILADEIEDQMRGEIMDALMEWADTCGVREPDFEVAR